MPRHGKTAGATVETGACKREGPHALAWSPCGDKWLSEQCHRTAANDLLNSLYHVVHRRAQGIVISARSAARGHRAFAIERDFHH